MQINENSETLKNGSKAKLKQKELTHKLTSYVLTLIPVKYMCACVRVSKVSRALCVLSICEVASVEQKGREGGIVGEGRRTVRRPGVSSTSLPLKLFYTYNGMHGAEV